MSTKVYDWVSHHANQTPDQLAMVDLYSERHFTYGDMELRTTKLANGLAQNMKVTKGDRIALLANNTTDYLEIEFACLKLGAVFVPLNWRLSLPELTYITSDCNPTVLIYEDIFRDAAEKISETSSIPEIIELSCSSSCVSTPYEALISQSDTTLIASDVTHDDLWVIMYTSGTTGRPKGAMITHGMTFWNSINLLTPHHLSRDMVNLCVLPLFHTGGLNCYCNPAVHLGGLNLIMRSFEAGEVLKLFQQGKYKISHFLAVPTVFLFMSQHPLFNETDFSTLKILGVGGAPVPKELQKLYMKRGLELLNGYGMTETSPSIAVSHLGQPETKLGSSGLPVLHADVVIADKNKKPVTDPNQVGEIWVKGPLVTPGYYNNSQANGDAFIDGWFRSGDAGYLDSDGYLYIVDRWKDMYISGGENVYPAEIENIIYKIPQVAEVAVIGIPDNQWGEVGEAVIVIKPEMQLSQEEVLDHCSKNLAKFKQPQKIRFIKEMPHNATGKILKRALRD